MYDAVVIGAGPAGLSTALTAAIRGAKVKVCERRAEIGVPIRTSGAVSDYWMEKIRKAGLAPPRDMVDPVFRVEIVSPSGASLELERRDPIGYVVDMERYEKYLAKLAEELGVEFELGRAVRPKDAMREGRFLVGADGALSDVRRLAWPPNPPSDVHFCVELWFDRPQESLVIHATGELVGLGYAWAFPHFGLTKVGAGVPVSKLPEFRLREYVAEYAKGVVGDLEPISLVSGLVPTARPLERVVCGNVALVGDAANMVNAATGGGIQFAILAGERLGRAISEGNLAAYDRWYRRSLKPMLGRLYRLKGWFVRARPRDLDALVAALSGFELRSGELRGELLRAAARLLLRKPKLALELALRAI